MNGCPQFDRARLLNTGGLSPADQQVVLAHISNDGCPHCMWLLHADERADRRRCRHADRARLLNGGGLSEAEREALLAHIEKDDCRHCLAQLHTDLGAAGTGLPAQPAGWSVREALDELLQDELLHRPPPEPIRWPLPPTACGPLGQVDTYHIMQELGGGTYGVVFKAYDEHLERPVALKVLRPELAAVPALCTRFVQEARAAAAVKNPHVVVVHQAFSGTPRFPLPYIVMEYVDGAPLQERLPGPLDPGEAVRVVREVALGLAAAHVRGVVHRDVKPDNIMLEKGPGGTLQAKLADFGVARLQEETGPRRARGSIIGTPPYMSPEAWLKPAEIDGRADLFSLGVVLYQLVTGALPFPGRDTEGYRRATTADSQPPSPRAINPEVSRDLDAVVQKLLARQPDDRYQTAEMLAEHLSRWGRGEPVPIRPHGRAELLRLWARRQPWVAALSAAATLLLVLVAAVSTYAAVATAAGRHAAAEQVRTETLRQAEKAFQDKRHRETAEALLARLISENGLYDHFMWTEADTLLHQTTVPEGDADLAERIAEAKRNTAFLKRLDDIRLQKSVNIHGRLNFAAAVPKYQAEFEKRGFSFRNDDRAVLAAKLRASPLQKHLLAALDDWAMSSDKEAERKEIMQVTAAATGQTWRPQLIDAWTNGERLATVYEQIPIKERTPAIIEGVGQHLSQLGKDGIRCVEKGLHHHPGDFWLHFRLGALIGIERPDASIGAFRAALAIRPDTPAVLMNIGGALYFKKDYDAAIAELESARDLDPRFAFPHTLLGGIYRNKKEYDKAIAEFKKAIELDPEDPAPYVGLRDVYRAKKDYHAAINILKEAAHSRPAWAMFHVMLGDILLYDKKEYDAARREYDRAISIDPNNASAHRGRGDAYRELGRLRESVEELQKAHTLMPRDAAIETNLHYSEVLLTCDQRLPAIRRGAEKPTTPSDAGNLAVLAAQQFKKEYALAYRLFIDALADPKNVPVYRFGAACAAIHFAAGDDVSITPDVEQRNKLQKQARVWLAADFDALRALAASDKPAERQQAIATLTNWLEDSDLLSVRDPEKLKAMPDDERKAWQQFWEDIHAVLEKSEGPKRGGEGRHHGGAFGLPLGRH
jgi:tetratricopeptide (TPR) repeat protein